MKKKKLRLLFHPISNSLKKMILISSFSKSLQYLTISSRKNFNINLTKLSHKTTMFFYKLNKTFFNNKSKISLFSLVTKISSKKKSKTKMKYLSLMYTNSQLNKKRNSKAKINMLVMQNFKKVSPLQQSLNSNRLRKKFLMLTKD